MIYTIITVFVLATYIFIQEYAWRIKFNQKVKAVRDRVPDAAGKEIQALRELHTSVTEWLESESPGEELDMLERVKMRHKRYVDLKFYESTQWPRRTNGK